LPNYYQILGLAVSASEKEIRDAYLRLAKEAHPDLHPEQLDSLERFKNIQEAYRILSSAELREAYDEFLHGFEDEGHARQSQERLQDFGKSLYRELLLAVRWEEACLGCVKSLRLQNDKGGEEGEETYEIQIPAESGDGQLLDFGKAGTEERLGLRLRLKVIVPQKLNRRQKALLRELEILSLPESYPRRQAFRSQAFHA
jgi:DnaJ-class molecular chaperone